MSNTEAHAILEPAATRVRDPKSGRSIWVAGLIQDAKISDTELSFTLQCHPDHSEEQIKHMHQNLIRQITEMGWEGDISCNISVEEVIHKAPTKPTKKEGVKGMEGGGMAPHGGPINKQKIPGVKHILAVASGKGGVGKSTVSVNLAASLQRKGFAVGIIDADVYGPSIPMMMNISGAPIANDERQIIPLEAYGIKCMSMGFLVEKDEPIIWRGPMVMGAIRQFFQTVAWGELDYLIVDLPPGTGDAQLTMIQAVDISGAVIVTTPQEIAVQDAVRGVEMFIKLDVPIVGIVENMSLMKLPDGTVIHPFGQGGGARTADRYNVQLLAQLPLDERTRLGGDIGIPISLSTDDCATPFLDMAQMVVDRVH